MSDKLAKEFEYCVKHINSSKSGEVETSNQDKLEFYALYKQATLGKCTGARPGRLNVVARYKYDSWKKLENLSKDQAKEKFIEKFKKVVPKNAHPKL